MERITTRHAEREKIIKNNMLYLTLLKAVRNKNIDPKVLLSFYCSHLKLMSSSLVPACGHCTLQGSQTTETSATGTSNRVRHIVGTDVALGTAQIP